jgi:peptide deformylase
MNPDGEILPILTFDHPSLRRVSPEIEFPRQDLATLARSLRATMLNAGGCGIAAPMVGLELDLIHIDSTEVFEAADPSVRLRLFPSGRPTRLDLANARIVESSRVTEIGSEANLCFPGVSLEIERPIRVAVEYRELSGESARIDLEGFDARVLQHELDHVRGILFVDRVSPVRRGALAGKLRRISSGEIRPQYPMLGFRFRR